MAEAEELLDEVAIRMPSAAEVRARGSRRRARRRTGAVATFAAMVMAGTAWAMVPGPGGDSVRPADSPAEKNPYIENGQVTLLEGRDLPQFEAMRWEESDWSWDESLPVAGINGVCPFVVPSDQVEPSDQVRYTRWFDSEEGGVARQRVIDYSDADQTAEDLAVYREALTNCGLSRHGKGAETYYEGVTKGGPRLRVSIEHGSTWISVVEEQDRLP
ncbi:hypothetical protein [Streptomyces sp. NBC_01429]|uniref:hypothetical protein n=1 Tax=Streptomyces sp. NBC_01429 TaxID=2903862 RepID=UPI002E2972CF|nr:hypothetical protein [Streptomyces sp. NBC_01429]